MMRRAFVPPSVAVLMNIKRIWGALAQAQLRELVNACGLVRQNFLLHLSA